MARNTYTIELCQIDVVNGGFTRIAVIDNGTFYNLKFSNVLNGIGECTFQLDIFNPKLNRINFVERKTQIVVKRNGTIVWFGPYFNYEGQAADVGGMVLIRAYSYLFHLKTRYTDKSVTYAAYDQADIARALVQTAQDRANGELNIVFGSEDTAIIRDRTYEYGNIAEKLSQLSNVIDGFDFSFFPRVDGDGNLDTVLFSVHYPYLGSIRNDLPTLKLGQNISAFGFGTNGELFNAAISEGEGTGTPILSTYDTDSTDSSIVDLTDALQQSFSRIETHVSEKDVSEQTTLDEHLIAYMTQKQIPAAKLSIQIDSKKRPLFGEFSLGDYLNVDINIGDIKEGAGDLLQYSGQIRVLEIGVDIDTTGKESMVLKFLYVR